MSGTMPSWLTPRIARCASFLDSLPGHKTVVIDCIPTVENLAQIAFDILKAAYYDRYGTGLRLAQAGAA